MSRFIDKLPEKAVGNTHPKVFVFGASRYVTNPRGPLQKLYVTRAQKPFKGLDRKETAVRNVKLFIEAIKTTDPRHGASPTEAYGRAELDKWFAGYDIILGIPSYIGDAVFRAYGDDPEVVFIYVERDPDAWVRSIQSTIGALYQSIRKPPLCFLRYFDALNHGWFTLTELFYWRFSDGKMPTDVGVEATLRQNYIEYTIGGLPQLEHDVIVELSIGIRQRAVRIAERVRGWNFRGGALESDTQRDFVSAVSKDVGSGGFPDDVVVEDFNASDVDETVDLDADVDAVDEAGGIDNDEAGDVESVSEALVQAVARDSDEVDSVFVEPEKVVVPGSIRLDNVKELAALAKPGSEAEPVALRLLHAAGTLMTKESAQRGPA
ncbi:uncharacterized protein B0I36DRAFT_354877 [Microdochium trichocladiopsis]|uniref:Uncharacterized protein n=1 Tax=Microdochium trichocladiopsis TaxID=1682393 RepID=A0A9P9BNA3_9PEZI|nr:uncharacterized protein B0I36DRAFT_354877 [Microdochium trichocladiopsis]KAH7018617.1 hypothetical protein B0I36DRAFT_354877 [Microdochium trichocladiopsis]